MNTTQGLSRNILTIIIYTALTQSQFILTQHSLKEKKLEKQKWSKSLFKKDYFQQKVYRYSISNPLPVLKLFIFTKDRKKKHKLTSLSSSSMPKKRPETIVRIKTRTQLMNKYPMQVGRSFELRYFWTSNTDYPFKRLRLVFEVKCY